MTRSPGSRGRSPHAVVIGLAALGAAFYLVARAIYVPLTYDEASSFHRYIEAGPAALFDFATATNHLLNSLLTRLSSALFGSAEWALRLPNVLSGLAYLAGAAGLAWRARHRAIGVAGFLLLSTNPYGLEYLALSRGYGLSIAFLTCGMWALLRWCDRPLDSLPARRDLALALGLAALAVAASYAVLPAFLGFVAVAVVRFAWALRWRPAAAPPPSRFTMWSSREVVAWAIVTALFTALVFSRERVLSSDEFVPIRVRAAGLFEDEMALVKVFRSDSTGRLRELPRRAGGIWVSGPVQDDWELRIALPITVDRNLASLDVIIGDDVFRRDRRQAGPWRVEDAGEHRVLVSTKEVQWRGGSVHRRLVAAHTAATVTLLAALGAGLVGFFHVAVRARLARREEARIIAGAGVWVASVAAAPLYLMQRDGQLFFGGTSNLVADTLGSLVAGTAYGAEYPPALLSAVFMALALAAGALPLGWLFRRRAGGGEAFRAPAVMLGVLAVIAVQVFLQHHLFGTPYPIARTALFLLPLLLIFVTFFADALASLGGAARRLATAVMIALAVASAWNGARAANLSGTLDWSSDSTTPEMLDLVAQTVAADRRAPGIVRVGVDWMFYPVAQYYAERQSNPLTRYEVMVLPGDGRPFHFVYATPSSRPRDGEELRRFPASGAVLWRRPQ